MLDSELDYCSGEFAGGFTTWIKLYKSMTGNNLGWLWWHSKKERSCFCLWSYCKIWIHIKINHSYWHMKHQQTFWMDLIFIYSVQNISEKNNSDWNWCYDDSNHKFIRGRIQEGRQKEIMTESKRQVFQKIYPKMTVCLLQTSIFSLLLFCCYYIWLIIYTALYLYIHFSKVRYYLPSKYYVNQLARTVKYL